jgi:hypothetical protein
MIIADLVTREDLRATRDDLKATLDLAVTRQTIIFGGMLAAAVAIGLAAIPLIV